MAESLAENKKKDLFRRVLNPTWQMIDNKSETSFSEVFDDILAANFSF